MKCVILALNIEPSYMACHILLTVFRWASRVFDHEIQPIAVIVIKVFIDTWAKLKDNTHEQGTVLFGRVGVTTVTIPTLVELKD